MANNKPVMVPLPWEKIVGQKLTARELKIDIYQQYIFGVLTFKINIEQKMKIEMWIRGVELGQF